MQSNQIKGIINTNTQTNTNTHIRNQTPPNAAAAQTSLSPCS